MDEVTLVKKRFRKEQWKQLIAEYQTSGMIVDDWCELNNVSRNYYYYWLRRLREDFCESLPQIETPSEKPVTFKKLEVTSPLPNTQAAVIIRLPHATLEIADGTSQQTIQAVHLGKHLHSLAVK